MKKLIGGILPILFLCILISNVEAMRIQQVAKKWDNTSIAPDTDWFSINLGPIERNQASVKHTFQFMCPTATVINLQITYDSIIKVYDFNSGVALSENSGYVFSAIIHQNMTYNIQHKTGTQNCSVAITESLNADM